MSNGRQDDPAALLMLEAISRLGLSYRAHPDDLEKWKAQCPICRAWTLRVFENGRGAAATCQNDCNRVEILRAFADALAQNEADEDLPEKRRLFLARLGVPTEPEDWPDDDLRRLMRTLRGGRAFSVYLLPDDVTALESARERIELEMQKLGDPSPMRLEDVLVAAVQEGLRSWWHMGLVR